MERLLLEIFDYSINQIDNLFDYYLTQYKSVSQFISKNAPKYRNGYILGKYFNSVLYPDKKIELTSEEEEIISIMLDGHEVIDSNDDRLYRVSYKLKKIMSRNKGQK